MADEESAILPAKSYPMNSGDGPHSYAQNSWHQGTISEEKVHSFNVPKFYPSMKELGEIIDRNGYFSIERMDTLIPPIPNSLPSAQTVTLTFRVIMEQLIKKHFGNEIVEELFARFTKKLAENPVIFYEKNHTNIDLFILLKRKRKFTKLM
ncbi:hypothetical protein L1049_003006 [Liquidambar formosana]|uniref:SAM dependent carboxyl methyltransferase n=1 Tax=Liquidambar formosana TaxID=63359 RepID=A0AAP0NJ93_LIQFO